MQTVFFSELIICDLYDRHAKDTFVTRDLNKTVLESRLAMLKTPQLIDEWSYWLIYLTVLLRLKICWRLGLCADCVVFLLQCSLLYWQVDVSHPLLAWPVLRIKKSLSTWNDSTLAWSELFSLRLSDNPPPPLLPTLKKTPTQEFFVMPKSTTLNNCNTWNVG